MGLVTNERRKQSHSGSWTAQRTAGAAVSRRQTGGRCAAEDGGGGPARLCALRHPAVGRAAGPPAAPLQPGRQVTRAPGESPGRGLVGGGAGTRQLPRCPSRWVWGAEVQGTAGAPKRGTWEERSGKKGRATCFGGTSQAPPCAQHTIGSP